MWSWSMTIVVTVSFNLGDANALSDVIDIGAAYGIFDVVNIGGGGKGSAPCPNRWRS